MAKENKGPDIPAWVVTFADLMSLMMCFFVLLFAFSETETEKFKAVAGSMAAALGGVQWIESEAELDSEGMHAGGTPDVIIVEKDSQSSERDRADELYRKLEGALQEDLESKRVVLEKVGRRVVIRFPENVSFRSGSAALVASAVPLIQRVASVLDSSEQTITIGGHTDDQPISTRQYRSNWVLSAARAVTVAEQVLGEETIDPNNLVVSGYADTRPLVANDSAENRAKNRRVEIIVEYADEQGPAQQLFDEASQALGLENVEQQTTGGSGQGGDGAVPKRKWQQGNE